jgi:dTDP-4-amino-4,6-dideoxygalactose transaminase
VRTPFVRPYTSPQELKYISEVLSDGNSAGGGAHAKWCAAWLENITGAKKVLLTNSATDALEMASLLLDFKLGDEIIMPSYTFSSTANAFVLRGAVPVFLDVDPKTMNIDVELLKSAITANTKAILVVHYAGASCDMSVVQNLCKERGLFLIEDAAQALLSKYEGQHLGTFGDISCISFHATKNVVSGEGGALLVNSAKFIARAEVILEKGTNRSKFLSGEVDKYSWVDIGSSFLMSEITAAYLHAQLENAVLINEIRKEYWIKYQDELQEFGLDIGLGFAEYSPKVQHNSHLFYIIVRNEKVRSDFISQMRAREIVCASHYVPLHSSEAGTRFGRSGSRMPITDSFSSRLVRLPMWSQSKMPVEEIAKEAIKILKDLELKL